MAKRKKKMEDGWTDPNVGMTIIEKSTTEEIEPDGEFEPLPEVKPDEKQVEKICKPKKIKMPPTSEIFSIKDQGDSKLVIKKDGTKLTIPK